MNVYEKLIDILIAICIMLLFPMLYLTKKSDVLIYQAIQTKAEQFVEEIITQGKITKEAYERFHESINGYSEAVQIILSYEETIHEPEYKYDVATRSYTFTGDVMEYEQITPGEEIIDTFYKDDEGFLMEPGGYIKVTVQFMKKDQAVYCGGTVRAYFSLCNFICNYSGCVYNLTGYLVCTG